MVADEAPAETNDVAARVQDREHDAVAKAVVAAALFVLDDQAAFDQRRVGIVGEYLLQPLPVVGRIAEAEARGDLAGQAAALQIVHGLGRNLQLVFVEARRAGHRLGQRRLPGALDLDALRDLGHLHAGVMGEVLDRVDEAQAGVLHDETDGAAVGAAAEAMVELLGRADRKRGRLFRMERAAGRVVGAGLLQRDIALHHVDDVDAGQQFLDEGLGDHGRQAASAADCSTAQPPLRLALTSLETSPMSARPATLGLTRAMTLPMSAGPLAPASAIAAATMAATSAADKAWGM